MSEHNILVVNSGSSSVKFAVFSQRLFPLLSGEMASINTAPHLSAQGPDGNRLIDRSWDSGTPLHDMLCELLNLVEARKEVGTLGAIGHRVAIGGLEHSQPVIIDAAVLARLKTLIPLAPLHQTRNLEPIRMLAESHPHLQQVACFDTAFHRTLPNVAQLYGLPRRITDAGGRRYGFHGISYEYISSRLLEESPGAAKRKTIIAHLGSGASLCALQNGKSIATTMGFSPLSGLVMGTRPGDLDPGLMIWLLRELSMSVDEVETMLYQDAGLKGVSGTSSDLRDLLASTDANAREAVDLFVYRIAGQIGALSAALGGLEVLVFTAGIGEHSSEIRSMIAAKCKWLGLRIDENANQRTDTHVSTPDSDVIVRVIPTDEERMIAYHTAKLVLPNPPDRVFPS